MRILPRSVSLGGIQGSSVYKTQNDLSPESPYITDLFSKFVTATTFEKAMEVHRQLCDQLGQEPSFITSFYPLLKSKVRSWRTRSLWAILDEKGNQFCYHRGNACSKLRVLIIGAGPSGLRAAIEYQLLGAKVVVLEKRDSFTRNNVLHLWPFVIHDLKSLGAKIFYGKFCTGSIDHISIRQLQLVLLKVALLLGVEVHENVTFEELKKPPLNQMKRTGWRAKVFPSSHPVEKYVFDAIIGAGGARTNLQGFTRTEDRHKLAIAITANFENYRSADETKVPEISGVSYIFHQKFFQKMYAETGVDLENISYYKDDTHYFVMTAKKTSLLEQHVLIQEHKETSHLLAPENIDREMLKQYVLKAVRFATLGQLKKLDFCLTPQGKHDISLFDFTSVCSSDKSCDIVESRGHKLLKLLVGDSLIEPFWPTGSGCARGFLSAFDAAWIARTWFSEPAMPISQIKSLSNECYKKLREATPENLQSNLNLCTINPKSRYTNFCT